MVSAPALTSDVMKDVKDNLWGVVFCAVLWPGVAVAYLIWCLGDAGRYCTKAVIYVAVTRPRKRLHPVERYPSQDLRKVEEPTIPDPGQVQSGERLRTRGLDGLWWGCAEVSLCSR